MSPKTEQRYQEHLDKVSRSFAFCIGQLRSPLKAWVGLTYLICRVLDTVEDAMWERAEKQLRQLDAFENFVREFPDKEVVASWSGNFPLNLPSGEQALIQDSPSLFEDLKAAPARVREVVSRLVLSMSGGMRHFCFREEGSKRLRLQNLSEVNQYCLFVAGVVGEALADLVHMVEPKFKVIGSIVRDAHHFGLFLQKVNLLKDQTSDESQGRFLVPNRDLVLLSSLENAHGAMRFLSALPMEQMEFRRFCAWSLFLGLESLLALAEGKSKVDRLTTLSLMQKLENHLRDESELGQFYLQKITALSQNYPVLQSQLQTPKGQVIPAWVSDFYQGQLEPADLQELGLGA